MSLRRAIASLGLVGALGCGLAATASVATSDSMSNAIAGRSLLHRSLPDETVANRTDDNSDDIAAISLAGLAVEIEFPKELEVPPELPATERVDEEGRNPRNTERS